MANIIGCVLLSVVGLMSLAASNGSRELFDPENSFCCESAVFPYKASPTRRTACCGASIFDPWSELCCDNKVMKSPEPENADSTDETPLSNFGGHFGGQFHSFRAPAHACCKDKVFNYMKEFCCDGVIHPKPTEPEVFDGQHLPTFYVCCGTELINATGQECCNMKVTNKTKMSEGCCGDDLIDYEHQLCCSASFESTEKPSVHNRDTMSAGCCLNQKMDYMTQACCDGKILSLPEDPALRAVTYCCGEKLIQSNESVLCCNGTLIERTHPDEQCCGNQLYKPQSEICCFSQLFPLYSNSTFCCGEKAFDESKEACCYDKMEIVPLGQDKTKKACC